MVVWNEIICSNIWPKNGFETELNSLNRTSRFFSQKDLVGTSNYDKKDRTIEGAKERFEQTKKKRD